MLYATFYNQDQVKYVQQGFKTVLKTCLFSSLSEQTVWVQMTLDQLSLSLVMVES